MKFCVFLKRLIFENFAYIAFGIIFILGFIFGNVFSGSAFDVSPIREGNFNNIFFSYLSSVFVYLLFIALFGLSLVGVVAIPLTVFFRGLGIGSAVASLYSGISSGLSLWPVIILMPHFILFAVYIIYSAKPFFAFSFELLKLIKYGNNFTFIKSKITELLKSNLLLMCFMLAGALIYCFTILFMQSII